MSFRSTTSATTFTSRGFRIVVDWQSQKVRFVFDSSHVDATDPVIADWLTAVAGRVGLGPIEPEPYWGFADLEHALGVKLKNCFFVTAESKVDAGHEYFHFDHLEILSGFSFSRLIDLMASGNICVDFDARSGHNHGTKFRLRRGLLHSLYDSRRVIF